jgi:hypothetical protein
MTTQTLTRIHVPSIRFRFGQFLPLASILGLQTILALSLNNTAFQDEALYLYAGRQYLTALLGGPPVIEPYGQYIAGLSYFYPLIAGILDALGGAQLARMFSLVCILGATIAVYLITRTLFDKYTAIVAAGVFAVQGSVLFLARLATFDAMCIGLLALATCLALYADRQQSRLYGVLMGVILAAAVLTKFAALLFAPTVYALMAWQICRSKGLAATLWPVISSGVTMLVIIVIPVLLDPNVVIGLTHTTTNRTAIFSLSRLDIVLQAASYCGILLGLGLLGALFAGKGQRLIALLLLGSSLLAPAYHVYIHEIVSLQKHVVFSMFFAAPLAGWGIVWLSRKLGGIQPRRYWLVSLAICLLVVSLGFGQAESLYDQWPNSHALTQLLLTQVRPNGRILAEEMEVPRYYLQGIVNFWQWNQLFWFYYTDRQGHQLQGIEGYKAAIAEGYFDLVILRYGPSADVAYHIDEGLHDSSKQYELIGKIPFTTSLGTGNYWVWRRTKASSIDFF